MTRELETPLDITTLLRAYRSGEVGPVGVVRDVYRRIERSRAENAWISLVPEDEAVRAARALGPLGAEPDRPLYGIPFAVKDNIDVAGLKTTAACPEFAYVPEKSAPAVEALTRAGAICIGKTNLDQFATGLVGTRSPYGACENAFDPAYVSGGSSSGSALVVALGLVSFALGTDTAGSGRVPAALNNVVGLKPTVGSISTAGVVAACRSLDCVSVFALSCADAARVRDLAGPRSLRADARPALLADGFLFAVPEELTFGGDPEGPAWFERVVERLVALGGTCVKVPFQPFSQLGDLLYGPWVVERYMSVGTFVDEHPEACVPVTREIITGAKRFNGVDVFRGLHELAALRKRCDELLAGVDVLVTPTVPAHARIEDDAREPRAVNDRMGTYSRFVNFLGRPALAVPAGFRSDGLPLGVSLVGVCGRDEELDLLGAALHAMSGTGMGRARHPVALQAISEHRPREARLAVVGAHMRGMPLHAELVALGARFVRITRTESAYRLVLLPHTKPEKPGLIRRAHGGHAIEVELWDLSWSALGLLLSRVGPPLAIGSVRVEDGELVKGFVCEGYAQEQSEDISQYGGFRAYMLSRSGTRPVERSV